MLQAYIDRAKHLLNGKAVYVVSIILLLAIGLTYYFINRKGGTGAQAFQNIETDVPAATEIIESEIVVDISGAVLNPGIYKMPGNSRVGDALALAGGVSLDASVQYVSRNLNLAQKINDSEKIYIPFELDVFSDGEYELAPLTIVMNTGSLSGSQPSSQQSVKPSTNSGSTSGSGTAPANTDGQKTNANSASLESLDKLSGIGPAYAQKIIDNRPYKDFLELTLKSGVPKSTLEKIKSQISF